MACRFKSGSGHHVKEVKGIFMKAVILAGGLGSRITEESQYKPKPMIEIGGKPILWHIMKSYYSHGINEFIICCGYKGYLIKEYFKNYFLHNSDITFDLKNNKFDVHNKRSEEWKVTLLDTGENSMTGGRLSYVKNYVKDDDIFLMTYGDGLSDINIKDSIKFHREHKKLATISAVFAPGRFGALEIGENQKVTSFNEKPLGDGARINGGFFVLSPKVLDRIQNNQTIWEKEPLESLAKDNELVAFKHDGYWQSMDTMRDKIILEDLYSNNAAPWVKWKNI